MNFFSFKKRIRHPFFPALAAEPAASARGRSIALAGTFQELARAAAKGAEARRAVYVLTSEGEPLSGGERDELWRLFQVPVYALLTDCDGSLVAWECEAQNGLHLAESGEKGACACGRPGARLMPAGALAHAAD
jgi:hypothetical protein